MRSECSTHRERKEQDSQHHREVQVRVGIAGQAHAIQAHGRAKAAPGDVVAEAASLEEADKLPAPDLKPDEAIESS